MIFAAVRKRLLDDAGIAAAVGTRVYPGHLPQTVTAWPAITITLVSTDRAWVLTGPAPLVHPRFQIDCWSQERPGVSAYEEARALGDLVRRRLEAYAGDLLDPAVSPDSVVRAWIHFADQRELFEPDVSGGFWRESQDWEIWHRVRA